MNQSKGKASPKTSKASTKPNQSSKASKRTMVRSEAPAAYSISMQPREPRIRADSRSCTIAHRELVCSVTGSTNFTVSNSFALNPGIATTFPWLSTQALGWEQYRFKRLKFCYYTRCATSVPGSVILAPDYDAADSAPSSEQQALTYRDSKEEVPWVQTFECTLDPRALLEPAGRKYVRYGNLAANLDIKTYDGGNLHLCTIDGTAVAWGKLWVDYEVEFSVPQTIIGGVGSTASVKIATTSASRASPFSGTQTITGGLNVTASAATLTINQVGQFLMEVDTVGTVITYTPPTITGTAAVATLLSAQGNNATSTAGVNLFTVNVTVPGQTVIFDFTASATTITASNVRLAPYLTTNA